MERFSTTVKVLQEMDLWCSDPDCTASHVDPADIPDVRFVERDA